MSLRNMSLGVAMFAVVVTLAFYARVGLGGAFPVLWFLAPRFFILCAALLTLPLIIRFVA